MEKQTDKFFMLSFLCWQSGQALLLPLFPQTDEGPGPNSSQSRVWSIHVHRDKTLTYSEKETINCTVLRLVLRRFEAFRCFKTQGLTATKNLHVRRLAGSRQPIESGRCRIGVACRGAELTRVTCNFESLPVRWRRGEITNSDLFGWVAYLNSKCINWLGSLSANVLFPPRERASICHHTVSRAIRCLGFYGGRVAGWRWTCNEVVLA